MWQWRLSDDDDGVMILFFYLFNNDCDGDNIDDG